MKKLFFIAAVAGAALAGCTKNEVAPSAQNEITFAVPVVGTQTKAPQYGEIDNNTYPTSERFQVYSVWHSADFPGWTASTLYMNQVECEHSTDCWKPTSTEGKYYWPKEGKLTFAAYSPADLTAEGINYGANGLTVAGFAPSATTAQQYDFLYSERTYNQVEASFTSGDNSGEDGLFNDYKGVDIKFKHALSQIEFYFRSDVESIIDLKSVTIKNAQAKGTFNENINESSTGYEASPAWSFTGYTGEKADYNIYTQTALDLLTTTPVEKCNNTDDDCIIIPQPLDDVTLNIEYRILKGDGSYLDQNTTITLHDKKDTGSNVIDKWEMGKRYKYTIIITLDEIYFDPAVVNWTDVSMGEIVL